jgi:processive 1,2-diacylglycerol beta-glucosyltransferase
VREQVRPLRVLIVSATVGAGDAGNARELARRLADSGHTAAIRDFLEAAPLGIGKALSRGYEAELRHAPWAYELVFRVWYWFPFLLAPLSRVISLFTRKTIIGWARETNADVVVSTYSVATQVLGDMRRRAKRRWRRRSSLHIPAINCITDFGYHPFWGHKCMDLNLAVNPGTVAAVAARTGRPSMACAPLVGPQFKAAARRRAFQRTLLGLQPEDVAVLVSSGSWGVGAVRETLELVAARSGLVPVVACGHNAALHQELERLVDEEGHRAVVLGWTNDMSGVMAACDVVVENAGGLTSLEAMRAGVALVNFRPIPGHGRKSAAAMSDAGVSCWARNGSELVVNLERLGRPGRVRRAQLAAAAALFSADAAAAVVQVGTAGAPPRLRLRPVARVARAAYTAALSGALAWVGLTTGVGVAAAAGIGVAHPPAGTSHTIFLGVRLGTQELPSPSVQEALVRLGGSAVVGVGAAELEPSAVRSVAARGIDVECGGLGDGPGVTGRPVAPWALARTDSQSVQVLSIVTGQPVAGLVPDHSLSAFDLVVASSAHIMMVVPNTVLPVAPSGPFPQQELALPRLQAGQIYIVNGQLFSSSQLVVLLDSLGTQLAGQHLTSAPLSGLQ